MISGPVFLHDVWKSRLPLSGEINREVDVGDDLGEYLKCLITESSRAGLLTGDLRFKLV
jgi:hypothetical protein